MCSNIDKKIQDVLKGHPPGCKYAVHLTHDGFDKNCEPKSDLFDLYVWDNHQIHTYHYENWFSPGDADAPFYRISNEEVDTFFDHNVYNIQRHDFVGEHA